MKPIAITERHLYRKVFDRGERRTGRYVAVCVLRDREARRLRKANPRKRFINRIGLSVPKRAGGAVERNRVKRIIREGLRRVEGRKPLRKGFLIVIAARPGIETQKSPAIEAELFRLFRSLNLFESPPRPTDAPAP